METPHEPTDPGPGRNPARRTDPPSRWTQRWLIDQTLTFPASFPFSTTRAPSSRGIRLRAVQVVHKRDMAHQKAAPSLQAIQCARVRNKARDIKHQGDASGKCRCRRCRNTKSSSMYGLRSTLVRPPHSWQAHDIKEEQRLSRSWSVRPSMGESTDTDFSHWIDDCLYPSPQRHSSSLSGLNDTIVSKRGLGPQACTDEGGSSSQIDRQLIFGTSNRHCKEVNQHTQCSTIQMGENKDQEGGSHSPDEKGPADQAGTPPARTRFDSKRSRSRDEKNGERDDYDDDENGQNEEPKEKRRRLASTDKKFACPFFKHNPTKYGNERLCLGPGWEQVHRVKFVIYFPRRPDGILLTERNREHVMRRHTLPEYQCGRCFEQFRDNGKLLQHVRQSSPCVLQEEKRPEGIDRTQLDRLRKRGKKSASEVERWHEMYRIIFPEEHKSPSPCKAF